MSASSAAEGELPGLGSSKNTSAHSRVSFSCQHLIRSSGGGCSTVRPALSGCSGLSGRRLRTGSRGGGTRAAQTAGRWLQALGSGRSRRTPQPRGTSGEPEASRTCLLPSDYAGLLSIIVWKDLGDHCKSFECFWSCEAGIPSCPQK